jgi:hypothetical protein
MTYADFYLVLRESEQYAADPRLSLNARQAATKQILSIQMRIAEMGLTREKLAELAKGNGSFVLTPRNRQYSRPPKSLSAAAP